MHRLFVYGTLRRGASAHRLLAGARHVGPARTAPAYTLVAFDWYPGLVPGGETSVIGELYDVPPADLAALDAYEGAGFERGPVRLDDGGEAIAWFVRPEIARGRPVLPSGDFLAHIAGNATDDPPVEGG